MDSDQPFSSNASFTAPGVKEQPKISKIYIIFKLCDDKSRHKNIILCSFKKREFHRNFVLEEILVGRLMRKYF